VLIAHCGRRFDLPFLMCQCQRCSVRLEQAFLDKLYLLDTWELAKGVSSANPFLPWPPNYKLATLYQHVSSKEIGDDAHRAHVDVEATIPILLHELFWNNHNLYFHKVDVNGIISSNLITVAHVPTLNDDSDTDSQLVHPNHLRVRKNKWR
jgi:hypothetical protein